MLKWEWVKDCLLAHSNIHVDDLPCQYRVHQERGFFWITGDAEVTGTKVQKFKTLRGAIERCNRLEFDHCTRKE